jgi:hypothetical protein
MYYKTRSPRDELPPEKVLDIHVPQGYPEIVSEKQPTPEGGKIMRKILISGILAIVVVAGYVFLTPMSSPAAPVIMWTPEKVQETISPGASKTITVSFVSSEDMKDVEVRVVPGLQGFVTVEQGTVASLQAGRATQLHIRVFANWHAVAGQHAGTIQLKRGNRMISKPLPFVLSVMNEWVSVVDEGISFLYPTFGLLSKIERETDKNGIVKVDIQLLVDGSYTSQFGVMAGGNRDGRSIDKWFATNIDITGTLLPARSFVPVGLTRGTIAYVSSGPLTDIHLQEGEPVADVYFQPQPGGQIVVIERSPENTLDKLGYSDTSITELLVRIADSVSLQ